MLYFLSVWSILLVSCLSIGVLLLNWFNGECFERKGDRFVIAVWMGVVVLCVSYMAVALIVPLSPLIGGLIIIFWLIMASLSRSARTEIVHFPSSVSRSLGIGFLALALAVATLTSQQIVWFDTGLYHLPSMRWLSEFGTVPGIALINGKLGFTSSWFAFSAPFVPLFLGERVGGVTNGFLLLLAIVSLLIFIAQIFQNNRCLSDGFGLVLLALIIAAYLLSLLAGSPLIVSFSHDVPVSFLIGITTWSTLIITKHNSSSQPHFFRSPYIIPLFLGVGTVTFKLTAIPLALAGFLFYILVNPLKIQRFFIAILMSFIVYLPNALYAIITSGCPLYPSRFMCLNLPWLVPNSIIEQETSDIRGMGASEENVSIINNIIYFVQKRYEWFKDSLELQLIVIFLIVSIVLSIWLLLNLKSIKTINKLWFIFVGNGGTIFLLFYVPLWRMGIAYFILIFSLVIGYFIHHLKLTISLEKYFYLLSYFLLGLALILLIQKDTIERWLLPAKLPIVELIKDKINDVEYTYPANWTLKCWRTELPCTEVPIKNKIKLRDPNKGIKAGFINTQ